MAAPTTEVRSAVYVRDGYVCAACNTTDGLTFQHRAAVGMGGSKQQPAPVEGLTLCGVCNAACEASMQTMALAYGWKIRRWANPELVPVYYPHRFAWFRFEGTKRLPISGPVAVELMSSVYGPEWSRWYQEVKS